MKRLGLVLALSTLALFACSSTGTAPKKKTTLDGAEGPQFPPVGAVSLALQPTPKDGVLYQLIMLYEGRNEATFTGPRTIDEPQTTSELLQLELDFRQLPVAAPTEGDRASSLVLDALRRRLQSAAPGAPPALHTIEAGDDRLRTIQNEKIGVDLRGAQPKGDMTPRTLLNKPFALVVTDPQNNPKGVTLRGIPSVRKMLGSLPLRDALAYLMVARPEAPVAAGSTWTAKRFIASPVGRLGVSIDIEYRLVGFEKVDEVPCARVSIRAQRDQQQAPSELGFTFEQVRIELGGDAWIELETGQTRVLRIEDITAVSYERKNAGATGAKVRARYETRASLQKLDVKTTTAKWADGTKRFADVK